MEITDETELATGLQELYSRLLRHALEQDLKATDNQEPFDFSDDLESFLA